MVKRSTDRLTRLLLTILVLPAFAGPVWSSDDDPFEPVNRVVFEFNDTVDQIALRPAAKLYQAVMPEFAERGVRNFFDNLGEVRNVVHNGLQGKPGGVARSSGRLLINSTVGIGGLFDVATKIGIKRSPEDLGQTLGVWGLDSGPYLVIPVLGPSSLRDGIGRAADPWLNPMVYSSLSWTERAGVGVLSGLQTRADLLSAESLVSGDPYILFRQSYLSKREYDVLDGRLESDEFIEDDPMAPMEEDDFLSEDF